MVSAKPSPRSVLKTAMTSLWWDEIPSSWTLSKKKFPSIQTEQLDVTDIKATQDFWNRHPEVNVLINNAGVQNRFNLLEGMDPTRLAKEIETNLTAPILWCQQAIPVLKQHSEAAIVNISSGLGIVGATAAAAYSSSKAGLHMFTTLLRKHLEQTSVKVFEVFPPTTNTSMTEGRGTMKMEPEKVADEFWTGFQNGERNIFIGDNKNDFEYHFNRTNPNFYLKYNPLLETFESSIQTF